MSSFTTPLIVTPLEDGRRWRLMESFVYEAGEPGSRDKIIVPAGYRSDFASVLRIFWSILPPWGPYGKAAVLPDWLGDQPYISKAYADSIFCEAMKVLEMPLWKRKFIQAGIWLYRHTTGREKNRERTS